MFDAVLFINQTIEKQLKYLNSKEWLTYVSVCACENEILFTRKSEICHQDILEEFFNEILSEKSRLENCTTISLLFENMHKIKAYEDMCFWYFGMVDY